MGENLIFFCLIFSASELRSIFDQIELLIQFVRESRSPRETRWLVLRIRKVVAEYKSVVNVSAGSELRILSADLKFSPFGVEKTFRLERLGIL